MVTQNILDLLEYCIFDGELTEENFEWKIIDNLPKDFSYDYFHGVSKCVIIPKGAEYVIKIPFTGGESDDYDYYDEETDSYVNEEPHYWDFEYAHGDSGWDYCQVELILWKKARRKRIEKILCKPRLIGFINNHPIYIQERAVSLCLTPTKYYSKERTSKTSKICEEKSYPNFNLVWQTDVLEYYGEKAFNKMMEFFKDNYIDSDLHDGNIGYIGTRPVILDYSSWWD